MNENKMTHQDLIIAIKSLTGNAYMESDDLIDFYDLSAEEIQQIFRDYGETDRYEYIDFGDSGRLVPRKKEI